MDIKNAKILVVDDVPRNIQVVSSILQRHGFDSGFAQNGKMVFDVLKDDVYDLILLDIMMPGMTGYEVCEKLKEDDNLKDIPVVFFTAKDDQESISKGFAVGGVDYIKKPFNSDELVSRVKTHLKIRIQQKELEALNATKDKLFSIVAHDLKSPFTAILGYFDMMLTHQENFDKNTQKTILKLTYDNFKDTFQLIKNLLDWSRSQMGSMQFMPKMQALHKMANHAISLLQQSANQKNITLINEVPDDTQAYIDEGMIQAVIRNLISNAIKFTPSEGTITVYTEEEEDHMLSLCIRDTGTGISDENMKKIFNLTHNYTTYGTNNEKGTGLGLVICHDFVQKHKGKLWVESKIGEGSIFKFTMPKEESREPGVVGS
ncbi:hybrid sensor histidine kinase/response regulator [Bacteroidales bacterium]|nr:hybrid sensor histidine kinase/response regulator [Bacteroidales bacterium]